MKRIINGLIIVLLLVGAMPCGGSDLLNFPSDCDTAIERLEYTCRAQEKLRCLHNVFVKWTEKGLTQVEYDSGVKASMNDGIDEDTIIPDKLKALYPYKDGMSVVKMEAYIAEQHKPRQQVISENLGTQRALVEDEMQVLTKWDTDMGYRYSNRRNKGN